MDVNIETQVKQGLIYTIRLLTISKRSEQDIAERLKRKGYQAQAIEKIVAQLKTQHLIDDFEFSKNKIFWATHGSPVGRRKLWIGLRKKGIANKVIDDVLQTYSFEQEKEKAREAAVLRLNKLTHLDHMKQRRRLYDYLTRRGFSYEICREVVAMVMKDNEND